MGKEDTGEGPLKAEALARDEWREDAPSLEESDAPGHTLPESERDRAKMTSGSGDAGAAPRAIPPPD